MKAHQPVPGCDGRCTTYVVARGLMSITETESYVKAVQEIVPDHMSADVAEVLMRYLRVAREALTDFQSHVGTPHVSEFVAAEEWWQRRVTK